MLKLLTLKMVSNLLCSLTSNGVLYGRQVSFAEVRDGCLKVRQHVTLLDDGSRLLTVVEPFTGYGLLLS